MNIPEEWPTVEMLDAAYEAGSTRSMNELSKTFKAMLAAAPTPPAGTPSAQWRKNGETDPHGERYQCERAELCMGNLTDDELANAVFLHGNGAPDIAAVLRGEAHMPLSYLTAAKDRIRWLSRKLEEFSSETPPAPEVALPDYPSNEALERLWENHQGHPADFAADVLERWGGWQEGLLGYGGSASAPEVEPVAWTDAFEEWAKSERMDMEMHPIHYLFLDSKTYAARQGWKAGMKFKQTRQDDGLRKAAEAAFEVLDGVRTDYIDVKNKLRAELNKDKS